MIPRRHDNAEASDGDVPVLTADNDPRDLAWKAPDQVTGPRPAPPGLPRRDHKAWRALELERFERETTEAAATARRRKAAWRQGFVSNPPRGLGRRGRRAWLAAERDQTRRWWEHRRASTDDMDARAIGALIIALLLGCAMVLGILTSRNRSGDQTNTAASGPAALTTGERRIGPASLTIDAWATGSSASATTSSRPHPSAAGGPTVASPVAGRWQPAPTGGVTPIPATSASPIDAREVALQAAPTSLIGAADLTTPVAAVTTWLTRTCPSTWTRPYGDNMRRARAVMTTAGWAAGSPTKDTSGKHLWTHVVVPSRQIRVCGDLAVHLSVDAPTTGGTAFVGYTANRVVTAPGTSAAVEHLVGARIVVRQSDGRWLVDRAVVGG